MNPRASIDHWLAEPTPKHEPCLFHYTTSEALLNILVSGNFRLGTYARMNDPRESKQWVADQLSFPPGSEHLHDEVDRLLRQCVRVGCFTDDDSPSEGADEGSLFHRGWARPAVWDRYSRKHQGACLVFDQVELLSAIRESAPLRDGNITSWGRVTYVDAPLSVPLAGAYSSIEALRTALDDMTTRKGVASHLYFTKNRDWESEREFRAVVLLWDLPETEVHVRLEVPYGDALKAIVVGEGFQDFALLDDAVSKNFQGRAPDILRCSWRAGAPALRNV